MIYLVIENYGLSYETNYEHYAGYTTTFENAKKLVKELKEQKKLYDALYVKVTEEYDKRYALLTPDCSDDEEDSFYKCMEDFENSIGLPEDYDKFTYDYYYVEIKEVLPYTNKTKGNE